MRNAPCAALSCMATTSAKPASVVYAARRPRQPAPNRSTRNAPYTAHVSTVSTISGSSCESWRRRANPTAIPSVSTGSE